MLAGVIESGADQVDSLIPVSFEDSPLVSLRVVEPPSDCSVHCPTPNDHITLASLMKRSLKGTNPNFDGDRFLDAALKDIILDPQGVGQ